MCVCMFCHHHFTTNLSQFYQKIKINTNPKETPLKNVEITYIYNKTKQQSTQRTGRKKHTSHIRNIKNCQFFFEDYQNNKFERIKQ